MTEITKVDPQEFGLDVEKAEQISKSFMPKIAEREGLAAIYSDLITREINLEVCQQASELRKKLVKVRTGISSIHKTEKAFYLAAGKFVDAWKNKETLPVTQMEEKLTEIEKYFENQEISRLEKLQADRLKLLSPYVDEYKSDLTQYEEEEFQDLLAIKKKQYEDKLKAEAKEQERKQEQERKEITYLERREKLIPFDNKTYLESLNIETTIDEFNHLLDSAIEEKEEKELQRKLYLKRYKELSILADFLPQNIELESCEFGAMPNDEYSKILESCKSSHNEFEKEQQKIKAENERIKKEAELKERKENLRKSREDALKLMWHLVPENHPKFEDLTDSEWKHFSNEIKTLKEKEDKEKQKQENKRKALEKELREKKEKEAQEEKERKEKERKEKEQARLLSLAPEKDKLEKWVSDFKIPDIETGNFSEKGKLVSSEINSKFEAFKLWAETQLQSIK